MIKTQHIYECPTCKQQYPVEVRYKDAWCTHAETIHDAKRAAKLIELTQEGE